MVCRFAQRGGASFRLRNAVIDVRKKRKKLFTSVIFKFSFSERFLIMKRYMGGDDESGRLGEGVRDIGVGAGGLAPSGVGGSGACLFFVMAFLCGVSSDWSNNLRLEPDGAFSGICSVFCLLVVGVA